MRSTTDVTRVSKVDKGLQVLSELLQDIREGVELIEQGMDRLCGIEGEEDEEDEPGVTAPFGSILRPSKNSPKVARKPGPGAIRNGRGENGGMSVRQHVMEILKPGVRMSTQQIAQAVLDRGYKTTITNVQQFANAVYTVMRKREEAGEFNRDGQNRWFLA